MADANGATVSIGSDVADEAYCPSGHGTPGRTTIGSCGSGGAGGCGMTTIPFQPTTGADHRPEIDSLAVARRHRAALLHSIQQVEEAVAAPAQESGWRDRVADRLHELSAAFADHVVVTEGPAGLYAELLDHAPRLSRRVHVLIREHSAVVAALSTLEARAASPKTSIEDLRGWTGDLLRELSRHRQRGADVVYEAYHTDIGGET